MIETPVTTVWEQGLSTRSLPGGMPLPDEQETPLSEDAERVLLIGDLRQHFDDPYLPQPAGLLYGRRFLTIPVGLTGTTDLGQRVFRYQLTSTAITGTAASTGSGDPASMVHEAIESLKENLAIDWERLLDLLDLRVRTFHAYRKAGFLPKVRLPDISARVNVLQKFVIEDVAAARTLVTLRAEDVRSAFGRADYSAVESLFERVRDQLTEASAPARAWPLSEVVEQLDAVASVIDEPGFEAAARAYAQLRGLDSAKERLSALIDIEHATHAGHEGGDLTERWDFLPALTHREMDDVRDRARNFVMSDAFSPDAWTKYLTGEADMAWQGYAPVLLPPDSYAPLPAGGDAATPAWQPNVSEFGVPTRYSEPTSD